MKGRKPDAIAAGSSQVDQVPAAPSWLAKDAKAEWRRVAPVLVERKVLTEADMGCLEGYCVATGRVREIERALQLTALDPRLVRMQNQAIQTVRQLAAELGLTPVSRSRPAIRDEGPDDDIAGLDL